MSFSINKYDIKYFFDKDRKIYNWFIVFVCIGFIFAIVYAVTSDSYLLLLNSSDNILIKYVNGSLNYSTAVFKLLFKNFLIVFVLFLLGLNFWSSIVSFFVVGYQSFLFLLIVVAIVVEYSFMGFIISLLIIIPINIIILFKNIIFSTCCVKRSLLAKQTKTFSFGFSDKSFYLTILCCLGFDIIFSFLINLVLLLILKSSIFILF